MSPRTMRHVHSSMTAGDVEAYREYFPQSRLHTLYALDPSTGIDPNGLLDLRDAGVLATVMVDNGLFNRNNHGRAMEPRSAYLANSEYLRHCGPDYDEAFLYDEFFNDPEHNQGMYENQRQRLLFACESEPEDRQARLREFIENGLIPVIHDHKNAHEEFMYLVGLGYKKIAIGTGGKVKKEEMEILQRERYCHDIWLHSLGVCDWSVIKNVAPDSVDSTLWCKATGNGSLMLRFDDSDPNDACIREVIAGDSGKSTVKEQWDEDLHIGYLRDVGLPFSKADLVGDAVKRRVCNLYAIEEMTAWLNRVWMPEHCQRYSTSENQG